MNRWGLGLAAAALVITSGCGGSSDGVDEPRAAATSSATPKLMELADACVEVNQAAENTLGDIAGIAQPELLNSFADALDVIAGTTDERGSDAVSDLAQRSRDVSETLSTETDGTARLEAGTDMLSGYKRLQDSCQAVGSPLSLPS